MQQNCFLYSPQQDFASYGKPFNGQRNAPNTVPSKSSLLSHVSPTRGTRFFVERSHHENNFSMIRGEGNLLITSYLWRRKTEVTVKSQGYNEQRWWASKDDRSVYPTETVCLTSVTRAVVTRSRAIGLSHRPHQWICCYTSCRSRSIIHRHAPETTSGASEDNWGKSVGFGYINQVESMTYTLSVLFPSPLQPPRPLQPPKPLPSVKTKQRTKC